MTTHSSTPEPHPLPSSNRAREAEQCKRDSSTDELRSMKLYSAGVRGAMAVVLSLVGIGSAMGQPVSDGRPEDSAQRQRVFSEIREAKAAGQIRRWSPVLIEIPLRGAPGTRRAMPIAPVGSESMAR